MPRPRPNFKDFEHLFYGLKYIVDKDKFNVNSKITITCSMGHEYITSITKIKNLNQDYKECPHCKKSKIYKEVGIPFTFFDEYSKKYGFKIVNIKDFYNRWEDSITFECIKDGFKIEKKSLSYLENNLVPLICENCIKESSGILNDTKFKESIEKLKIQESDIIEPIEPPVTIFNKEISDSLNGKLKEQNRWYIKEYNGTRVKSIFVCKKCGEEKTSYAHDLIINADRTGCINCRRNGYKNSFIKFILDLCEKNEIIPLELKNIGKDDHKFKCNKCGEEFIKNCRYYSADDFTLSCPTCFKSTKRKTQTEVSDFIKSIISDNIEENNRTLISPYELDIYIPTRKIAIEYCGGIWHSSKFNYDKNKHFNKWNMCKKLDVRLLTIFDDEWTQKRSICESRIKNCFGLISHKVFARNCEVKIIDNKVALDFCATNHIQGKGHSFVAYGLFLKDQLISVMTFSKPSISKNAQEYDYELNRFCSLLDYVVIGGASRLLSSFKKDHKGIKLVTFCDMRWGSGNVYEKLGFIFIKHTPINYYYIGSDTKWLRKHRFNYTKQRLMDIYKETNFDLTEEQVAIKNGLYRIYDCGHNKYEMVT